MADKYKWVKDLHKKYDDLHAPKIGQGFMIDHKKMKGQRIDYKPQEKKIEEVKPLLFERAPIFVEANVFVYKSYIDDVLPSLGANTRVRPGNVVCLYNGRCIYIHNEKSFLESLVKGKRKAELIIKAYDKLNKLYISTGIANLIARYKQYKFNKYVNKIAKLETKVLGKDSELMEVGEEKW